MTCAYFNGIAARGPRKRSMCQAARRNTHPCPPCKRQDCPVGRRARLNSRMEPAVQRLTIIPTDRNGFKEGAMGWLSDLLKDYPALTVARERLALEETKRADLETENARLREENSRLQHENESLRGQVPTLEFVESRGALFKRKRDGSFEPIAFCPDWTKRLRRGGGAAATVQGRALRSC